MRQKRTTPKLNPLHVEFLEIAEVIEYRALQDVTTFALLKLTIGDDESGDIRREDWIDTPQGIKQAIYKALTKQAAEDLPE
jgi:hypothetical protein